MLWTNPPLRGQQHGGLTGPVLGEQNLEASTGSVIWMSSLGPHIGQGQYTCPQWVKYSLPRYFRVIWIATESLIWSSGRLHLGAA